MEQKKPDPKNFNFNEKKVVSHFSPKNLEGFKKNKKNLTLNLQKIDNNMDENVKNEEFKEIKENSLEMN